MQGFKFDKFCLTSWFLVIVALFLPLSTPDAGTYWLFSMTALSPLVLVFIVAGYYTVRGVSKIEDGIVLVGSAIAGCFGLIFLLNTSGELPGETSTGFWVYIIALWAMVWGGIAQIAAYRTLNKYVQSTINIAVPVLFGLWLIFLWQMIVIGLGVPQVLLPSPSAIAIRLVGSLDIIWADFVQTFVKAVITGFILGSGSAFLTAILVDRVPFLKRGLLPLGNLISALPIIGVAPIMVMWFGFDWQSKVAVVVIMTFFPMLVNTVTGLAATNQLEKDLMSTYASNYWQTLIKLRLPVAMPFIFNALKINSTLAMIGAIVAEFFGTPIVGMGFRISTEVGRMNVDMVWAEIFVAALAGSSFYGLMALLERYVTFWHPSYRQRH